MSEDVVEVSMQDVIGHGYADFWNSKQRYVVCKGSRASKKSTTAALKIIVKMMQYPKANTLVIRQTAESLKDSCYAQLLWAIDRLGVNQWWKATKSPMEIEYIPTGQKILFRGLDNPLKVTSITVKHGYLCFAWLEEAYEVDEDAFDKIDQSLRGQMDAGYYIQWLVTFNPWDASSWLKRKFFDTPDDDVLAMTTTYQCNEWLSDADLKMFERMKRTDPEQYKVAGLGDWGLAEGQFFKQWSSSKHVIEPFKIPREWVKIRAMDWGSARPYAVLWFAVDYDGNAYCYRELYGYGGKPNEGTGETAKEVAEKIAMVETRDENVYGAILDNACWAATGVTGPTIAEELNDTLYAHHLPAFDKSSKGRIEGANAIKQRLIGNETEDGGDTKPALVFFSNCIHTIRTLPMLAHDKTKPETYDTKGEDHCTDAVAYFCLSRPWAPTKPKKKKPHDGYAHVVKKSAWTY